MELQFSFCPGVRLFVRFPVHRATPPKNPEKNMVMFSGIRCILFGTYLKLLPPNKEYTHSVWPYFPKRFEISLSVGVFPMEGHCFHLREKISFADKLKYKYDFASWDFEKSLPAGKVKREIGKVNFSQQLEAITGNVGEQITY